MDTLGYTLEPHNDDCTVIVPNLTGTGEYAFFVPAGQHFFVMEFEDTRDNSRYFEPVVEGDVDTILNLQAPEGSAYEYVGHTCHIRCPRRHADSVVFNIWPVAP